MQIQTKITLDHWGNFGKSRPIIYVRFVIKTRGEPIAFSKVIYFLKLGLKWIILPIHLKTTDTMEESSIEAMVDTGAI